MLKRSAGSTGFWTVGVLAAMTLAVAGAIALQGCKPKEETPAGTETMSTEAPTGTQPPEAAVHVRREIHTFSADQVAAYRKGVALMQSRGETDPTSWLYQANIHGFPGDASICAPPTAPSQPAWATCQHGNFFFLSWHRIYLYYFERILRAAVREAVQDPNYEFSLPYWNYEVFHELPEPFRLPADSSNPLYVAQRVTNCNDGSECVSASEGSSSEAMTRIPFCNCGAGNPGCAGCQDGLSAAMAFGSQFTPVPLHSSGGFGELESQPHNVVHDVVGGSTGWMGDVDCAARDAIFWLHHANIDRLWQVWLNQGNRENPLGSDNWKSQTFTFFDENKQPVTMTGCDVLNMASQLDYQYEDKTGLLPVENVQLCTAAAAPASTETPAPTAAPPTAPAAPKMKVLTQMAKATRLADAAVAVKVPVAKAAADRMLALSAPEATAAHGTGHVWLVIEKLQRLAGGGYYQVYLNLPAGTAPDPQGPHFVGNISLFGADHHGQNAQVDRAFDITDEVQELRAKNLWNGQVELTFVRGNPKGGAAKGGAFVSFQSVKVVEN